MLEFTCLTTTLADKLTLAQSIVHFNVVKGIGSGGTKQGHI